MTVLRCGWRPTEGAPTMTVFPNTSADAATQRIDEQLREHFGPKVDIYAGMARNTAFCRVGVAG